MAISWGTIKSLLLFFGPILLPKAISYYRSVRAAPSISGISIRKPPPRVSRALLIIFITSFAFLVKSLPYFSPENIFSLTSSRLQIPTDVLFTRLAAIRPQGLTSSDELLRGKLHSLESRLLFFQFGPEVITGCLFCNVEDPKSYLYYALPAVLTPHVYNLVILAIVTSGLFTGKEGAIWRTTATIAAAAVALAEIYFVSTYNYQGNARATRIEDIEVFFSKARVYRFLSIAAIDGLLGWMLYLSSTNRAFVVPPAPMERIEASTRVLDGIRSKMSAMGVMKNTIVRDPDLRDRVQRYWVDEGRVMGEMFQEREVVEGLNNALENRINMAVIEADAESYAQNVVGPLQALQDQHL